MNNNYDSFIKSNNANFNRNCTKIKILSNVIKGKVETLRCEINSKCLTNIGFLIDNVINGIWFVENPEKIKDYVDKKNI